MPSKGILLIVLAVSNLVAVLALPVSAPTILGAIKEVFSPINFTPPADICKLPVTLLNTAAGTFCPNVSLAMDKEPDEINNPLKGLLIVPKVDVLPKASIFPATVTFFEALIFPCKLISNLFVLSKSALVKLLLAVLLPAYNA